MLEAAILSGIVALVALYASVRKRARGRGQVEQPVPTPVQALPDVAPRPDPTAPYKIEPAYEPYHVYGTLYRVAEGRYIYDYTGEKN